MSRAIKSKTAILTQFIKFHHDKGHKRAEVKFLINREPIEYLAGRGFATCLN